MKCTKLILQGEMSVKQLQKAVPSTSSDIHILNSFWHCKDREFSSRLSGNLAGGDLCGSVMERDLQRRSRPLSPSLLLSEDLVRKDETSKGIRPAPCRVSAQLPPWAPVLLGSAGGHGRCLSADAFHYCFQKLHYKT